MGQGAQPPAGPGGPGPPELDARELDSRLAMPLAEAMTTQRSVRRVRPDPVDDAIIRRCLELAVQAPTGSNGQNWRFLVVRDPDVKAQLAAQYRRVWKLYGGLGRMVGGSDPQTARILRSVGWQVEHFEQIPALVVCCLAGGPQLPLTPAPPIARSSHYGSIYPAVQNLLLAARAAGLGASLITLPLWSATVARRILELPLRVEPCCIVTLGWPLGRYGPKARRPVTDLVHVDRWGNRAWSGTEGEAAPGAAPSTAPGAAPSTAGAAPSTAAGAAPSTAPDRA